MRLSMTLLTVALVAAPACKKTETEAAADAPADAFPPRPEPGPPEAFTPQAPTQTELSNGIPVYTITDDSLPLVSIGLTVPTGSSRDPEGQAGRAALGASMLGESAGDRTALEQAAALEALAASVSFGLRREATTMTVESHADRLGEVLPLAADALLRPGLTQEDWDRVKQQHLTLLRASLDDNREVASLVARRRFWGESHAYGTPSDGTPESVEGLDRDAVKAWVEGELHAGGAAFVVVGDVTSEEATDLLEASFGSWEAKERAATEAGAAAGPTGLVLVDRPGSTQTVFHVTLPGEESDEGDRAPLDVASVIMGGSFTSRLNRRLREELGYTYGARMGVGRMQHGGIVQVTSNIRGDATADALKEVRGLLDSAATDGFSEAEVARGRAQVISRTVDQAETRAGLQRMLLGEIIDGRPPSAIGAYVASVDAIGKAPVDAAGDGMAFDDALVVLVGDKAAIEGPLKEAGFTEWTEVSADGADVR